MKAGRIALRSALFLSALLFPPPSPLASPPAGGKGEEKKSAESAPSQKKEGEAGKKGEKPAGLKKAEASGKDAGAGKAGGTSEKEEPAAEPRPVPEIEKDMRKAQSTQNFLLLWKLVQEAALLQDPAAYRMIIANALRGEDRDLELKVFRLFLALDDPAALPVICQEALKSTNFKTRIILLGIAFQKRQDPRAYAVLVDAIKDPSRPVALTAVRWLREAKDPDRSVPALIEALKAAEKSSRGRLYYDLRDALRDLTGASLEVSADWRTYWESAKTGKRSKTSTNLKTQVVLPKFFSIPIESDRILFIIDVSGSMVKRDPPLPEDDPSKKAGPAAPGKTVVRRTKAQGGEEESKKKDVEELPMDRQRLFRVKRELTNLIRALPPNVTFTVMSFNHQIAFIGDTPNLVAATAENKKRAEEWVKGMQPNGETWTDTAFERALGEVKDVDTVYLLSDGAPFRNGKKIPEDKVLEGIKDLNRFVKARVHTFGFLQEGANLRRFLIAVAGQNDGKFVALR